VPDFTDDRPRTEQPTNLEAERRQFWRDAVLMTLRNEQATMGKADTAPTPSANAAVVAADTVLEAFDKQFAPKKNPPSVDAPTRRRTPTPNVKWGESTIAHRNATVQAAQEHKDRMRDYLYAELEPNGRGYPANPEMLTKALGDFVDASTLLRIAKLGSATTLGSVAALSNAIKG
jgi:hypothetical protein